MTTHFSGLDPAPECKNGGLELIVMAKTPISEMRWSGKCFQHVNK